MLPLPKTPQWIRCRVLLPALAAILPSGVVLLAAACGGGQTELTPEGEEILARYRVFRAAAQSDVRRDFAEAFARGG